MKIELLRMNIKEIKDPDCEYCKELETQSKKNEFVRHILTECKKLAEVWEFFRSGIKGKWNAEWSDVEMVYGPEEYTPQKMKVEYVFLRVLNHFTGLRSKGNFNSDVVTPIKINSSLFHINLF